MKVSDVAVVKKSEGKEFQKQDVVIGDETRSYRLVLWEEDVGSLEEGKFARRGGPQVWNSKVSFLLFPMFKDIGGGYEGHK